METEIATEKNEQKNQISITSRGLQLATLNDLWRFSQYVAGSGLAPKNMEKPESIFVAIEMGLEVGLPPMAALQNTAVVNGRPTIYGDAALALVRGSGLLDFYEEAQVGTKGKDDFGYRVSAKRKGDNATYSETFTVADAKTANLWGKAGPWTQYPARMLKFRARSFLLRDAFGDVLKGMRMYEEARDYVDADVEIVEDKPKEQKLFAKTEKPKDAPKPETEQPKEEPAPEPTPEPDAPTPPKEGSGTSADALEELGERLAEAGLTQEQCLAYAKKNGLTSRGKIDEFAARKILRAWETVKEFIAKEGDGNADEF